MRARLAGLGLPLLVSVLVGLSMLTTDNGMTGPEATEFAAGCFLSMAGGIATGAFILWAWDQIEERRRK